MDNDDEISNIVICPAGYVIRQREWDIRGERCLNKSECPDPNCPLKRRLSVPVKI